MKKVFISVPMKERTSEDINKSVEMMKSVTKAYYPNEELEFIDTFVPCNIEDPQKRSVYCLGQAITKMTDADLFVCPDRVWNFTGCVIERDVAHGYGISVLELPISFVCPDIIEKELNKNNAELNACNSI